MEKKELNFKDSAIALVIAFVACQLFVIFGELILTAILMILDYTSEEATKFLNSAIGNGISSFFQLLAFVSVFLYYHRKTTVKKLCITQKINIKQTLLFIALGLITMASLTIFVNYFCLTLNLFNKPSPIFSYEITSTKNFIISLFSLAIFPALGEELVFRGIIYNGFKKKGEIVAIIVSSLFFALFHFNLSQLYYPFLFGLLLGFIYSKTKNILVPMLVHFVNNAFNLTIQYFTKATIFKPTTFSLIFMIIGALIFILILAYLFITSYKQESKINASENGQTNQPSKKQFSLKEAFSRKNLAFWLPVTVMVIIYIILA